MIPPDVPGPSAATFRHPAGQCSGSGPDAAGTASFKRVDTTLGNVKGAIGGTCRKIGPDHAERYLASFAWRHYRRYRLKTMIPRFLHGAARTSPRSYQTLIAV